MPGVAHRNLYFLQEVIDELDDQIRTWQNEVERCLHRIEVNRIYLNRSNLPEFMRQTRENAIMASRARIQFLQDRIVAANLRQNEIYEEIRIFRLNNPSRL
ncbi:MAG: 12.2 kDa DNA primase-like protein [Plant associated soymovirus 1]|nr:MAG: 12.2 kDa DNA primase-like protein [Plant associated soymovirus 1]